MRGERRRFAELVGAAALAVGQPLLDVFGRSTETFVFRGVDGRGYVLFALAVVLVPPTVLWLTGWLIGRLVPRSRERVHLITVASLVGMAALIAVRWITALRGGPALSIAISGRARRWCWSRLVTRPCCASSPTWPCSRLWR